MPTIPVHAIGGSDFQAGRIIDDSIFFDGNSMSTSDIQSFLNSKVPNCDTNHTGSGSNTPPFTCLKDYRQTIPGRSADSYCSGSVGSGNKSSAEIISAVASACSVNPKVLLVLLQKEESLITDTWPWTVQYNQATGYACPDTAACDTEYAGFFNQVWYAARQYQRYSKQASVFAYKAGVSNYIQYNPNGGCGGSNIFIVNQATAGLYNYTPYQPNAAALNNLTGTGDSCSAYGNRNFWRLFNDWFGATTSNSNTDVLSFVRLNHGSGKVENIGLPSIGSYNYISRNDLAGYPAVAPDGAVVPRYWLNGDLSFIRLNHGSGKVEVISYSANSNFKSMANYTLTGYPAVAPDHAVIPMFWPGNGDLSFIRLNHGSGKVEVISYSVGSNFKTIDNYTQTGYPAVAPDGAVVPLYWPPNGDLSFVRLNHGSGKVELITYSSASNFKTMTNYTLTGYPSVAPDGAVVPTYKPNGDLSFIRLNHGSGKVEVITYSAASNFKTMVDYRLVAYPAVAPDGAVTPLYSR